MLTLQVKTDTDWSTLAARQVGSSPESEVVARIELITLRNGWISSNHFPTGSYRIVRLP